MKSSLNKDYDVTVKVGGAMGLNIISWIVAGALAGLVIYFIFDRDKRYFFGTIFSGIVGAAVGGLAYSGITAGRIIYFLTFSSLAWSVFGALVLVIFVTLLIKSEENDQLASKF